MKLTVRTSVAQFLRQPLRYKQPRAARSSQSSQPASHVVSRPIPRGVRGISFARTPSRQRSAVDDLHPRWLWRSRYGHGEFDERKHPRAPAGRSDGGQFVSKNRGGNGGQPTREFVVPKQLGDYEQVLRASYDNIPNLTTAELQSDLHDHTRNLLLATTTEDRDYAELWIHRLNQELQQRDYSDEKASLAVKKRLWEAQHKYTLLQQQYRQLNTWLEQSRHTIWKSSESVRTAREKLAAVKQSMVELARVTGAKLPHDNPIRNWTFEQKLAAVADRILKSGKLAPEIARQLEAAVQPENLARMGAMIALLAAAHAFPPAGLAADATLLAFGGAESALMAHRLYLEVSSIQDELDLNSAAHVLEKELASNVAGKLFQRFTGNAIKGVKKAHQNHVVSIDRQKIRVNAAGGIPQKQNPAHLPLVPGKKKRPAEAKPALPKAVKRNQAEHRRMVKNQQKQLKDAIDNASAESKPTVKGQTLRKQGADYQKLSDTTLNQIRGKTMNCNERIGKGEGSVIDNILTRGSTSVYVETKFSIRKIHQRTINQLTNAHRKAKSGDTVILNVARKPTKKELIALRNALPAGVFERIKVVSSQTELFTLVKAALKEKKK